MENISLFNISSSYIMKQIFSNIEYNRFISLVKYSKKYQNNLEFNLKNNIHYNKYIEGNKIITIPKDSFTETSAFPSARSLLGLHYTYFIIHSLLNKKINIELNNDYKSNRFF